MYFKMNNKTREKIQRKKKLIGLLNLSFNGVLYNNIYK